MLLLNIPRILAEKGIAAPKKFLMELGCYPQAATAMLGGKRVRIDRDQVEKICIALHCTPNELFDWQPGGAVVDARHPMRTYPHKAAGNYRVVAQPFTRKAGGRAGTGT